MIYKLYLILNFKIKTPSTLPFFYQGGGGEEAF